MHLETHSCWVLYSMYYSLHHHHHHHHYFHKWVCRQSILAWQCVKNERGVNLVSSWPHCCWFLLLLTAADFGVGFIDILWWHQNLQHWSLYCTLLGGTYETVARSTGYNNVLLLLHIIPADNEKISCPNHEERTKVQSHLLQPRSHLYTCHICHTCHKWGCMEGHWENRENCRREGKGWPVSFICPFWTL